MSGGGFLAFATFTGLIAGMLRAKGKSDGQRHPTLLESGLLGHFGTVSTVSGGSWFLAALAYSPSFRGLVEDMAANPESAEEIFGTRWSDQWLKSFSDGRSVLTESFATISEHFGGMGVGLAQDARLFGMWLDTGRTWTNFVGKFLESTALIPPDTSFGAPVEEWAQGKVWITGHTVLTPRGGEQGTLFAGPAGSTVYHCEQATALYFPANFSVVLGGDVPAPVLYRAAGALPPSTTLRWETTHNVANCLGCGGSYQADCEPFDEALNLAPFARSLKLCDVVSSSSAFLGGFLLHPIMSKAVSALTSVLPVWISDAPDGRAFEAAEKLIENIRSPGGGVSARQCEDLAEFGIRALIDGGYTENTGIAHAVASGATDVTVFLLGSLESFYSLFRGSPKLGQTHGLTFLTYHIFADDHGEVKEQFAKFKSLTMPNSRDLINVVAGTLSVTTLRNEAFGIAAGKRVTLRVISTSSSLSIGFGEDFRAYGGLLGKLVRNYADAVGTTENSEILTEFMHSLAS